MQKQHSYIKPLLITFITLWFNAFIFAQSDTASPVKSGSGTQPSKPNIPKKNSEPGKNFHKRPEYFQDTISRKRRKFDSTLFVKDDAASIGDYADELGKVYQTLNQIPSIIESFTSLDEISDQLNQGDSALSILKDRIFLNDRNLNINNLQMYNTLLDAMNDKTQDFADQLTDYDTTLDQVRKNILEIRQDTLMREIFRDSTLRLKFHAQLQQLKTKWNLVDSLVSENRKIINTLKSQVSAHAISINELLFRVDADLDDAGSEAFGKERWYLWERPPADIQDYDNADITSVKSEQQLVNYYFSNTRSKRIWLLITGLIFFCWVWWNYRALNKMNRLSAIQSFGFNYVNPFPWKESLIFVLSLAPLFDLHAPSIYIESVQFLLMILLTVTFWKKAPKKLFYCWCGFFVLFLLLPISRLLNPTLVQERWMNLLINIISCGAGIIFLMNGKKIMGSREVNVAENTTTDNATILNSPTQSVVLALLDYRKWIYTGASIYLVLQLLSITCNVTGRVTLTKIFSITSVYAFAQVINLGIFIQLVLESFLLQIQTSRIRKKYPENFEYTGILRSILNVTLLLAFFLWLLVFTTNLNLLDMLTDWMVGLFTNQRQVGSFNFTVGGIALFLGIIWLANFLQKYIAYFFGDTGDDASIDDKGQRSKLLVTRLILLTGGFLLAVAASGLAMDRITVILGALGVGIGLGLQSIVNNFVSGIILIFDRPVRIGDLVEVGDKKGRVKEIGIRSSTLLTEDGAEVVIPNGDVLSNHIVNWTLSNNHARTAISFTINNTAVTDEAALKEDIQGIVKKCHNVLAQRDAEIMINFINQKTSELRVYCWINDITQTAWTTNEIRTALFQYLESKEILGNG